MAIDAIDSTNASGGTPTSPSFDDALDQAEFQDAMVKGMVQVGGQLILMPMMKEMLGEAMSGGEG
ncbi:hypothetical protein GY26_12915 [Gammaproteobacteria bacterium MFB021]|nr:hypothetical protein GY26_12915 [Gammaproteobacteria bacterium MFB021]